jgi:hypothetical protein
VSDFESVIRKLPKVQRRALDNLAIGLPAQASQRTLAALADRGLIVGHAQTSRDRFGVMTWIEYEVPIAAHMAWCAICSEEWDAMSPEERAEAEAPDA